MTLSQTLRYLSDEYKAECEKNGEHDICEYCEVSVPTRQAAERIDEQHGWLYAVWMAFLADEETHELQAVLRALSEWMSEQQTHEDGTYPAEVNP